MTAVTEEINGVIFFPWQGRQNLCSDTQGGGAIKHL